MKVGGGRGARGTRPEFGRLALQVPAHVTLEMRIPGARGRERRMGSPELEIRRLRWKRPLETRQRRSEHGGGVRLEVHTLRQCLRQPPIDQKQRVDPLGVTRGQRGPHPGAHRVTDHDRPGHLEVVEHRHQIGRVRRHAERAGERVASATTTQVRRDEIDRPRQPVRHPGPRRVRPGDAVHRQHRRSAPPPGNEQIAARDRHGDVIHPGTAHLDPAGGATTVPSWTRAPRRRFSMP